MSTTDTFTATSTWTCPSGVTSVDVELWASGAGGGDGTGTGRGGGGGGGAYSKKLAIAVAAGTIYTVTVGAAPGHATDGQDSWFIDTATVLAKGGLQGATVAAGGGAGGAGGLASGGVGDTKHSGGTGASGSGVGSGGGGGGGAGDANDGSAGSSGTGGNGGATGGGNGGNGGSNAVGSPGSNLGGGGGGGDRHIGADSGRGEVRITYTIVLANAPARHRETPWVKPGQFAKTFWNGPREVVATSVSLDIALLLDDSTGIDNPPTVTPQRPFGPPWTKPGQFATKSWNGPREVVATSISLDVVLALDDSTGQDNPPNVVPRRPFGPPWQKPGQFITARWNGPREVVGGAVSLDLAIDLEDGTGIDSVPPGGQYPRVYRKPWELPGQFAKTQWRGPRNVTSGAVSLDISLGLEARGYNPKKLKPSYWGPHFPKRGRHSYWDGHFPEPIGSLVLGFVPPQPVVDPSTQAGAATLALTLQSGCKVTYSWQTQILKSSNGIERRVSLLTRPREHYQGDALIVGSDVRALRALIARYAPLGSAFLLGLAHDEVTVTGAATLTHILPVASTARLDWAVPGARVVVISSNRATRTEATVQSVTATSITVDADVSAMGVGARVMPAVLVFLDAQQTFNRHKPAEPVEMWGVSARAAIFGFVASGVRAILPLASPRTTSGAVTGLSYLSRDANAAANAITVAQTSDGLDPLGTMVENVGAKTVQFKYIPGATSAQQLVDLVATSVLVTIDGTYTGTALLAAGDAFAATAMSGGSDGGLAAVGRNGAYTTFAGHPLWNFELVNPDTSADGVNTLAEQIDLGGVPNNVGNSDRADFARRLRFESSDPQQWQLVKFLLWALRGRQRAFWVPTKRADLVVVSLSGVALTVSGPFLDWYDAPYWFANVSVRQGVSVTPAAITAVVDNGDGTYTLTLDSAFYGTIDAVSWLDLVRLESDDVEVTFSGRGFAFDLQARLVKQ